jgi:shikimate kinase
MSGGGARALVLIGPMGAGKTSIGRRVARALGRRFFDTDIEIVRGSGPIEAIFAEQGESRFRALERDAVVAGLATGGVVSLGGGAVMDAATRADLAAHDVVFLTVDKRVVAGRIRDSSRPLLQGEDAAGRWSEIMTARRPIYEQLADVTFDTSRGPLQAVVADVVEWAQRRMETSPDEHNRRTDAR